MRGAGVRAPMTRRARFALASLLVLVAAVYSIALAGPFHFDDYATVAIDPGAQWLALWWRDVGSHVRPLAKLSFVMSHSLGEWIGAVAPAHRLVNIAIHLAVVALFAALAMQLAASLALGLDARRAAFVALAAAAVVGLHPLATEAIAYIGARSMALGTLFVVASLIAYIRWRTHGGARWLAAALVAAAAGAASREAAIVAPLAWIAWEWARSRDGHAPWSFARLRSLGPIVAIVPIALGLAALVALVLVAHPRYAWLLEGSARIAAERLGEPSFIGALRYFGESLVLMRYPNIDPERIVLTVIERWAAAALVAVIVLTAWRLRASRPHLLFAVVWVALWLVPIYALPIRHDAIAERHFYPALWGVAFVAAVEIARRATLGVVPRTAIAAAALAIVAVTATRLADYRSEPALWEAARRANPDKLRVLNNLGVAYIESRRWDEAIAVLDRALTLHPDDAQLRENLLLAQERGHGPLMKE